MKINKEKLKLKIQLYLKSEANAETHKEQPHSPFVDIRWKKVSSKVSEMLAMNAGQESEKLNQASSII